MIFEGGDTYKLASGRVVKAACDGIFGLMPYDGGFLLTTGYDCLWSDGGDDKGDPTPLKSAERREIAEYMAAAWKLWASQVS